MLTPRVFKRRVSTLPERGTSKNGISYGPGHRLSFEIAPAHFAWQLCLEDPADRAALGSLARRCQDYLRGVSDQPVSAGTAAGVLLGLLRPKRVPLERSFVFGVYRGDVRSSSRPDDLLGVLYFLHPPAGSSTWYLSLLLLEPAARSRGLGTAIHGAFARWASARGGRRIVVSVARNNPRALHFWRGRMGYDDAADLAAARLTKPDNRSLGCRLDPAPAWGR